TRSVGLQGAALLSLVLSLVLSIIAIRNLPYIDFRAYKVGVHIPSAMQPSQPLQYSYIMRKDGEEAVFDQYPTDDSYEFVDMQLQNPEALPKISDFSIWNENGDFTEEILTGKKLVVLISNISKMSEDGFSEMTALVQSLENTDIVPLVVAASSEDEIKHLLAQKGWSSVAHYMGDATVVKTIIRSNPGIMLLNDGTVVKKYHHNNTPTKSEVEGLLNE